DKGRVKKRKSRPCRGPGGGAAQELTDPIGDDDLSECGSEGAFPGDLADYDENGEAKITLGKGEAAVQARALRNIPEGWARESLKCVFLLVQATARLEKSREMKEAARDEAVRESPLFAKLREARLLPREDGEGKNKEEVGRSKLTPVKPEYPPAQQWSCAGISEGEDMGWVWDG
ncbi:unnamed protein product, partial [Pylaiella littoralis]